MRIHSNLLDESSVQWLLRSASFAIPADVFTCVLSTHGSHKRARGIEVQLGTYEPHIPGVFTKRGKPKARGFKNSGTHGAGDLHSATYDEWGWFIARVFELDPNAIVGPYDGYHDFMAKTKSAYDLDDKPSAPESVSKRTGLPGSFCPVS